MFSSINFDEDGTMILLTTSTTSATLDFVYILVSIGIDFQTSTKLYFLSNIFHCYDFCVHSLFDFRAGSTNCGARADLTRQFRGRRSNKSRTPKTKAIQAPFPHT